MRIVVALLLVLHGLITAAQSGGSFNPTGGVQNPKWLAWWPTALGQSWVLSRLGLEKSAVGTLAGVLWLVAGVALVGAALGLLGLIVPTAWWRTLAAAGAVISLLLFVLYAHPIYAIGIGANIAILVVLLWAKWPPVEMLGS
jgi:hypothetical protein